MKNDSPLKKHHFWLLCGVAPLLTLIAVFIVSSSVGGKIAAREQEIKAAKDAIGQKQNPKPTALLEKAGKVVDQVSSKQADLHKINWDRQKHLYTWPNGSPLLREFNKANLKFGDPLPTNQGEFDEFKKPEVYLYEFSSIKKDGSGAPGVGMADRVAPTQFRGGWQRVLRHVDDWGALQLTRDQVWLMMEDIWVQRSLLDAVRSINVDMSTFRRAKVDKDGNVTVDPTFDEAGNKIALDRDGKPVLDKNGRQVVLPIPDEEKRKAVFRNRIWSIELELVQEGGDKRLVGTLTNQSERLQLMGVGNMMTLHVWFSKEPTAAPLVFKIGEEFLPGKGSMKRDANGRDVPANVLPIVPLADHVLPGGMTAEEIVRVEQVFDIRTVPVKRIEALALGFLDSRNADKVLVGPGAPFAQEQPVDPAAAPGGMGPMGGPIGAPGPMGPGGREGGPVGFGPGFGPGGTGTGKVAGWGGGPLAAVIDGNKKRYLPDGVTAQVRRMPVGIVVVVDQSYMQDMLLAFANSPLRFQITQVCWTRFRGSLAGTGPGSSSGAPGAGPGGGIDYGSGTINFGGSGDPDGPRGGGLRLPGGPAALGPSSVGPSSFPGPGVPGPGTFGPGTFGPMGPGYQGGGIASTVSESQITSGLVELSIYGVVSLYEKYEAPKPADAPNATAPPAPDPAPAPGPVPGPAPAPGTPPMTPKMRRRVRA